MTEIVWGPEIAVDGKRPEWLGDMDWVTFRNTAAYSKKWSEQRLAQDIAFGGGCGSNPYVTLIRLPADHPQYAPAKPHPAPSPSEARPEVVERALAFVRRCVSLTAASQFGAFVGSATTDDELHLIKEARAIVALLPEPVDADEVLARQMVLDEDIERTGKQRQAIVDGNAGQRKVALVLAAIKRGRALAVGDAA